MGQTLAEKIISEHTGHDVKAGELVIAKASLSLNKLIVQTLTDMEDTVKKSGLDIKLNITEKDVTNLWDNVPKRLFYYYRT